MRSHPFRLVVFDFDGTLVDSQGAIVQAMEQAFLTQDLPPPEPAAVVSVATGATVVAASPVYSARYGQSVAVRQQTERTGGEYDPVTGDLVVYHAQRL